MALPAEQVLGGKYEILGKMAEGGMGAIYKARHRLLDEVRVIKTLRADQSDRESLQQRFQQEARTAIRLKHPGIAQLHDFAIGQDGTAFIIMEFIDGVALDRALESRSRLSAGATIRIACQALSALDYLHAQGFVHRDISPDNLMLCRGFDGSVQVKIIDLGIAKDVAGSSGLTLTGTFLGKIRYCSPEHFSDTKDVDHRGDVYSFGLILYEMLTGRHPITGESFTEMAAGHLFQPPVPFADSDPEAQVPEALRAVILKALAKNPDERYQSAAELSEALETLESESKELESEGIDAELEEALTAALANRPQLASAGTTDLERLAEEFRLEDASGSVVGAMATEVRPPGSLHDGRTVARPIPVGSPSPAVPSGGVATPNQSRTGRSGSRLAAPWVALGLVAVLAALGLLWWSMRDGARPAAAVAPDAPTVAGELVAMDQPESEVGPTPRFYADDVADYDEDPNGVAIHPGVLALLRLPGEPAPGGTAQLGRSGQALDSRVTGDKAQTPVDESRLAAAESTEPGAEAGTVVESDGTRETRSSADALQEARSAIELKLDILEGRKKVDQLPTAVDDSFRPPAIRPPEVSTIAIFEFDLQLDSDGIVLKVESEGQPPDPAYAAALKAALLRTRFTPGLRKGEGVKGRFRALVTLTPATGPAKP